MTACFPTSNEETKQATEPSVLHFADMDVDPVMDAAYALAASRGMCCRADLDLLIEVIGTLPPDPVVVQLGAGSGTMALAVMAARDHITLWSFDTDLQALAWEWRVFKNAKVDLKHGRRYEPRQKDSAQGGADWLWGAVDLVIVDADHSFDGVIADVYAWRHRCGLMFIHDYDGTTAPQRYPGVRQACDAMWGETAPLHKAGWSAVFRGERLPRPGLSRAGPSYFTDWQLA